MALHPFFAHVPPTGVLRILELPRNLRRPVHNEKKLMGAWLERQQSRLEDVGGRQPGRAAARKEAEAGVTSSYRNCMMERGWMCAHNLPPLGEGDALAAYGMAVPYENKVSYYNLHTAELA